MSQTFKEQLRELVSAFIIQYPDDDLKVGLAAALRDALPENLLELTPAIDITTETAVHHTTTLPHRRAEYLTDVRLTICVPGKHQDRFVTWIHTELGLIGQFNESLLVDCDLMCWSMVLCRTESVTNVTID
jgi:hypothetical protein